MTPTRVNDSPVICVKNLNFDLEDLIAEIRSLPERMNDTLSEALDDGIDIELAAESCRYPEEIDPLIIRIHLPLGEEYYNGPEWTVSLQDLVTSLIDYWEECVEDEDVHTPPPISRVAEALREQAARLELAEKYPTEQEDAA
jgi:hypothetical protein